MIPGWDEIERREGFAGIRGVAETALKRRFESLPVEDTSKEGAPKAVDRAMTVGFVLFGISFMGTFSLLPETTLGVIVRFILFPLQFIAVVVGMLWLYRKPLAAYLSRGEQRLVARGDGLAEVAQFLGLTYICVPGGVSPMLEALAGQKWLPPEFRAFADRLGERSGMEDAVEIARKSGVMDQNVIVLGSEKQKQEFQDQSHAGQMREDGFHGEKNGVIFDLFEWVETQEDEDNIHHLTIVMKAPILLQGSMQVRSRQTSWPPNRETDWQKVDLGPRAFNDLYRLRATDQVEARTIFNPAVMERLIAVSHGDKFIGVASGEHLVFDIEGSDRFVFMDIKTGEWSDETIRAGFGDLIEALNLVDALAHAFMVVRKSS